VLTWPKSRRAQASIAAVVAILAAICVAMQIEMTSFNNFYFGPHKAYPYPYPDAHSAQFALYRDCVSTMLGVFVIVFTILRAFTASRRQ
jgi:hypothetical protein